GDLRRPGKAGLPYGPASVDGLLPAFGSKCVPLRRPSLRPHDDAATLTRVVDPSPIRSLARQWAILPATSRAGRPQESGIPHRRRHQARHRVAGRFLHRHHDRGVVGADLHRGAVDHRRLAVFELAGMEITIPGFLVVAAVAYAVL